MKEFDAAELALYDGKDGQPVYVAHKGRVYDVTASKLWRNGLHMKRHHAGGDMTTEIKAAPHETDKIEAFPIVGILRETGGEEEIPAGLAALLKQFPMLRRHPHPMTVHFPIAFFMAAPIFCSLYLITGIRAFDTTAWHCLGAGILFLVAAMTTGFYTWWLNFKARPMPAVRNKIYLAFSIFIIGLSAFTWRMLVPGILVSATNGGLFYLLLNFALLPLITALGWFGAQLTFPVERE